MGFLLAAVAAADAPAPGAEELERLRARAGELEERLRVLQARQRDLAAQRERLEAELQLAALRLQEGEEELALGMAAVAEARAALQATQARLTAAVGRLRFQLGLLAVLGRSGWTPMLAQALAGGRELERRITITLALVEDQRRRREEVARAAEERARALAELSRRQAQVQAAAERERARRAELAATRARVMAELAQLETERRRGAVALADLREAEARLERVWGHIARESPAGQGEVLLLRGGLPWPVEGGRIVRRYGRHRDPRYGTFTLSNGIALEVSPGEEVRAVAAGVVAYAQYLKGYGNLVILHHGAEVYSLYAGLATMLVQEGRRVRMAAGVGLAGPPSEGEGNLYFEIRIGRRSEDPLQWLKPRGR